ncbi:hypothetical protein J4463_00680 [Candidatus Pacearchaeota archaeon]|nr:hypothetical protein [Candidatus Pacearchaeota archaeon]
MKIVIDTNFIMSAVKQKVNIINSLEELFGIYSLIVLSPVIKELKKITEDKDSKIIERNAAKLAKEILAKYNSLVVHSDKSNADSAILEYVKQYPETITATLDRGLKQRIVKAVPNAKFLIIRGKNRIMLEE